MIANIYFILFIMRMSRNKNTEDFLAFAENKKIQ